MQNNDINDIDISSAYGEKLPNVFIIGDITKLDRNTKKLMVNTLGGLVSMLTQSITDGKTV